MDIYYQRFLYNLWEKSKESINIIGAINIIEHKLNIEVHQLYLKDNTPLVKVNQAFWEWSESTPFKR